MKNRPLLFTIIAILHLVEPIIKILFFKATTGFTFLAIFDNVMNMEGFKNIFEFWFLFPIAGLALYGVKKWSYPLFVGIQAYSIFMHLTYEKYTWPYSADTPHWYSLAILFCNIAVIVYFALPDVRAPFFDKSMRWWQVKTRFGQKIPCTLYFENPNDLEDVIIHNISNTGAFIDYKQIHHSNFVKGTPIHMNICFESYQMTVKAQIVAQHSFDDVNGIGVQFVFENIFENLYMKRIVRAISKNKKREESRPPIAA